MPPTAENRLRPRRTPRQPRSVETRARILDAAREVFSAHGYAAGTTNRIADAADLSIGSLYQYFPNKDAVLVELVREHAAAGRAEVLGALAAALTTVDPPSGDAAIDLRDDVDRLPIAIEASVGAMVRIHQRDRRLHQVLFEESPRPPSLLAELHQMEDDVVELVAAVLAGTRPHLADPSLTARVVVTTIESLVHRMVASDRPADPDQVATEITHLVTGYLAPSP